MNHAIRPDLTLRQKSALNGFVFEFADAAGNVVGMVHETRALALRYQYDIHLPVASRQVQAFLLVATYLMRR